MAATRFVVLGATGHVGSVVAARLLDAGKQVRVVARGIVKLADLSARGAEVLAGDVADAPFLRRAFDGVHAAFVLLPPYPGPGVRAWQDRTADTIGGALEAAGVAHVVALSSLGADVATGNGPIAGLHVLERRLERIPGLSCLLLRPGSFFENHLFAIGLVNAMGINGGAIRPDLRMAQVASRDIGEVAARRLLALDWHGVEVLELHGERDLTQADATAALGRAIGRPELRYVQFPYADAEKGMIQGGVPAEMAALFVEMAVAFNEGKVKPTQPRSRATSTPTSIERWASEIFAPVFAASAPRPPAEETLGHA